VSYVRFTLCCTCKLHVSTHGTEEEPKVREIFKMEGDRCQGERCKDCPGSDVYVITTGNGLLECCGCKMVPADSIFSAAFPTYLEMLAHLKQHLDRGDHVPMWCLEMFETAVLEHWPTNFGTTEDEDEDEDYDDDSDDEDSEDDDNN
jgi:hypothetical protein